MGKKQYDLCRKVLKRFDENGLLQNIILIGSWCLPFYKEYFGKSKYEYSLRTRDIDFLIPVPSKIRKKTDIAELLKDIGFIVNHSYPSGYMRLQHPDLIVEFLIPEKGKGIDKPFPLPQLGINAQTLRFLDLLALHTITLKVNGISLLLPHPANFALHKIIISGRRQNKEKAEKDLFAAIRLLEALIKNGDEEKIRQVYRSLSGKCQKKIVTMLTAGNNKDILNLVMLPICQVVVN